MSKATKRKHVLKELLDDDYSLPAENQQIVLVLNCRGNNLIEVQAPDDITTTYLVSMPTKFRKSFWVKRGDYVIIEPIKEGNKVKGELIRILTSQHIKYLKNDGVWPAQFDRNQELVNSDAANATNLFVNTNRRPVSVSSSDNTSEKDSSSDDDDIDDETKAQ